MEKSLKQITGYMFYVVLVCRNIKLHLKGQSSTKVKCNLTFLESSLQILSTEGADLWTELSSVCDKGRHHWNEGQGACGNFSLNWYSIEGETCHIRGRLALCKVEDNFEIKWRSYLSHSSKQSSVQSPTWHLHHYLEEATMPLSY